MPKSHSSPSQSRTARRREAHDPIPSNAISLTHAFDQLFKKVDEHPDIVGKFELDWSAALAKARECETTRTCRDLTLIGSISPSWQRGQCAPAPGVGDRKLTAYVCDPKSHGWKDLGRRNWFSKYWDEYVLGLLIPIMSILRVSRSRPGSGACQRTLAPCLLRQAGLP